MPKPRPTDEDGDDLLRLHPAIRQRHTSRHPFAEKDLPEEARAALREAAAREGAMLMFPGAWHAETVLDLVRDAESRDAVEPDLREDLDRWTRLGPEADTAVDGVPEYAFGPRKRDGKAPQRDFAGRRPVADCGSTAFEQSPHLALLSTPGESADLRPLVRDPVTGRGHVQMVLRMGYGPRGPATPRRPVRDVLEIA